MELSTLMHNLEVSLHEVLDDYTKWLVKNGYMDTDAISEEPTAVEEYLKKK